MKRPSVLIVDDDAAYARKLAAALEGLFRVELCLSEARFREVFEVGRFDLIVMDMRLQSDHEGLVLLKEALAQDPQQLAIVMTAYADAETYTDALEAGALTYLDKREFSPALIARTVEALVHQGRLRNRLSVMERQAEAVEPMEIIGASPAIRQVRELIRHAADDGSTPVLIIGESGVGKDLAARNIHHFSRRRKDGPFLKVHADRKTENVLASFLGMARQPGKPNSKESKGWIDDAKEGVLFIEQTTGMAPPLADALLSAVLSGSFKRVDGRNPIPADIQLVVAFTGALSLSSESLCDSFQKTGAAIITVPPLRERTEDIPMLAQYALQHLHRHGRTEVRSFRGTAIRILESLPWPGNVRELKSAIEFATVRADAGGASDIGPEHLPLSVSESPVQLPEITAVMDYQLHLARSEVSLVEAAIERFDTRKKGELAERLAYHDRFTFARRLRRNLRAFPTLAREFPSAARLFDAEGNVK